MEVREGKDFLEFCVEIREMMGINEAQSPYSIEECPLCCEEFEMEGEKKPMYLSCCKKNLCVSCKRKLSEDAAEKMRDGESHRLCCPYCRCYPLPRLVVDDKCLLKVRERVKDIDIKKTTEKEGIRCAVCSKIARKPHHRFVCLTCRSDTGKWLLSGEKSDREKIKLGTHCVLCAWRHHLYHKKKKLEMNEIRPVSQLFGYTRGQVEDASDRLQERLKEKGYLPRSLCIIYSLWLDIMEVERFEISTINRLLEVTKSTKKSVEGLSDGSELKDVALSDFSTYFQRLAPQLSDWCCEIVDFSESYDRDVEWAYHVSCLLFTTMEFVTDNCPQAIDEIYTYYLHEMLLDYIPQIVRRLPVDNQFRIRTILMIYNTCKMIEISWKDLAYGILIKREMICIKDRPKLDDKLETLSKYYAKICEVHDAWRGEIEEKEKEEEEKRRREEEKKIEEERKKKEAEEEEKRKKKEEEEKKKKDHAAIIGKRLLERQRKKAEEELKRLADLSLDE